MASVTGIDPQWARSFKVTNKPKAGCLLAQQILDPCYFQSMWKFCLQLTESSNKILKIIVVPGEIESILRMWADKVEFNPVGPLEEALFPALDLYAQSFTGWKASPNLFIEDLDENDEDEE